MFFNINTFKEFLIWLFMIDGYDNTRIRDLALQQMVEPEREEIVQAIKEELDSNPALWNPPVQRGYNLPPKKRRRVLFVDLSDSCSFLD